MNTKIIAFLALILFISCAADVTEVVPQDSRNVIHVKNSNELKNVLEIANPGDSIVLADGVYDGKFVIPATVSGTEKQPITLIGGRQVILDAGTTETGYVLNLLASYWRIKGITLRNGLKGLMVDGGNYNVIDGILVTKIGEEGIHFRKFSSHNTLRNSEINYTGLKTPDYGEGIYIGSAYSNWSKYSNGEPDKCDANQILNNKIGPYVAAECIDIKEGTTGGLIKGNHFESQGITGANSADSWIDVKGNSYLIETNVGINQQPSVLTDGYQVNCAYEGWGSYNEFKANVCEVNAAGYGVNVRLKSSKGEAIGNKVYESNKVTNAAMGAANIELTK
jgi:hypothetical protein